jgi:Uma2 family endonuclease
LLITPKYSSLDAADDPTPSLRKTDGLQSDALAAERRQEVRSVTCLLLAPEICVEVLSPSNTSEEISEKIALCFESGAKEVWICDRGTLQFRFSDPPEIRPSSEICPDFPPHIDL